MLFEKKNPNIVTDTGLCCLRMYIFLFSEKSKAGVKCFENSRKIA